jgi:hypothetical protein
VRVLVRVGDVVPWAELKREGATVFQGHGIVRSRQFPSTSA